MEPIKRPLTRWEAFWLFVNRWDGENVDQLFLDAQRGIEVPRKEKATKRKKRQGRAT